MDDAMQTQKDSKKKPADRRICLLKAVYAKPEHSNCTTVCLGISIDFVLTAILTPSFL